MGAKNNDIGSMVDTAPPELHHPCSPADAAAFLHVADELALARGRRMTRLRRKVLSLLLEAKGPAKAYDLLERLDGEGSPKPPTIYRALEFLQDIGLVHKIESLNAFIACGHAGHSHSAMFLICDACGRAEELHSKTTTPALEAETEAAGFCMSRAVIEVTGVCRACTA
ncbi:MAG: transcriptional repressor [Pseudomonadota bacterium]